MRKPIALILFGSLLMAAPAFAMVVDAQGGASNPGVRLAADQAQRMQFEQKVRQEMDAWQQRIAELSTQSNEQAGKVSESAKEEVDQAWLDAKLEWQKLQMASIDTWDYARRSFEEASQKLNDAWARAHSSDEE